MLKQEIDAAKRAVTTDSLQISIGEIASMYAQQELDIIPEFQRLFRWPIEKKTAFVESILIGIPIPPAFAYEKEDGTWELVDGLQRISTILEFMGLLRNPEKPEEILPPSKLASSTYLPSLRNVTWSAEEAEADGGGALDKALQLFFRRARLDFQVLKHPSDAKTKFDLFRRLNRGGEYANEQEVRTCSMVLANPEATRRIRELARSDSFVAIFKISRDQKDRQKDVEWAVRAIVHTAVDFETGSDVQEFLDRGILDVITSSARDQVIDQVKWTVELLHRLYGPSALVPHDEAHAEIAERFSLRALEALLVGISRNKSAIVALDDPDAFVRERVDAFWRESAVADMSASGLRGTTRLQRTVPFGEQWFRPNA